jgi:hypothetical protein
MDQVDWEPEVHPIPKHIRVVLLEKGSIGREILPFIVPLIPTWFHFQKYKEETQWHI